MMRIVIAGGGTGGHLMPALAIAEALRELDPQTVPVLVGAKRGVEASILPQRSFRYYLLPAEPLYRREWWKNLRWSFLAWRLWRECRQILGRERPQVVLGTGGYAAGPMLFAASRRGIPIVLQEQNAYPGVTTRWFASRAAQIHLGAPEAARYLPCRVRDRVQFSGNPITPPPSGLDRRSARSQLGLDDSQPVVFVFGGSQGASLLNRTVAEMVTGGLLQGVALLWGTGLLEWERYRGFDAPPLRQVRAFWDPMALAYRAADLVVSRAGAMTTAELCAFGLPSILVPLRTAAADHQTKNALALEACGAAIVLPESRLSAPELGALIGEVMGDREVARRMGAAALSRAKTEAARTIAREILKLVS